jgi:hypothetical protein
MVYGTAGREASRVNSVHPNCIHSQTLPSVAPPVEQAARRLGCTSHYANSCFFPLENIVFLLLHDLLHQQLVKK